MIDNLLIPLVANRKEMDHSSLIWIMDTIGFSLAKE